MRAPEGLAIKPALGFVQQVRSWPASPPPYLASPPPLPPGAPAWGLTSSPLYLWEQALAACRRVPQWPVSWVLKLPPSWPRPLPQLSPPLPPMPEGTGSLGPARLSLPPPFPTEDSQRSRWHTRSLPTLTQACRPHPAASQLGSAWTTSSLATSGPT